MVNFSTELKILIDAVQAASFVTEKKTGELVDKIAKHLPSHGFMYALFGVNGTHGIFGFIGSIFGARDLGDQSTYSLLEGIFSLVLTFINAINIFFNK